MQAVIFANSELRDPEQARAAARESELLIAADGGARHCLALGLTPAAVVGDLDSLSDQERAELEASGTELIAHPRRKDQTDLELAVRLALSRDATQLILLGALGGRWDQTLANLMLAGHQDFKEVSLTYLDGAERIFTIRRHTTIEGRPGDTVSLIPVGGTAEGVTTYGLEYPLIDGVLPFGSTLGVSNVLVEEQAAVQVRVGEVLCVHHMQSPKGVPK